MLISMTLTLTLKMFESLVPLVIFAADLMTVAPGLPDGMTFKDEVTNAPPAPPPQGKAATEVINLVDILADTDDLNLGDSEDEEAAKEDKQVTDISRL